MKNVVLIISYEGTNYLGFQKTKEGPSIENELEKALFQILNEKVSIMAASRTDKGVHARGQVVNFFTKKNLNLKKLTFALNHFLPKDIRVRKAFFKPKNFHPTLNSVAKEYHYLIFSDSVLLPFVSYYSWHQPFSLDINSMKKASEKLTGKHDFSAFANKKNKKEKDPQKNIFSIKITKKNKFFLIKIKADNFLYKMARNIVGTLVYIGRRKIDLSTLDMILKKKDRKLAGITAPAHGLVLYKIYY